MMVQRPTLTTNNTATGSHHNSAKKSTIKSWKEMAAPLLEAKSQKFIEGTDKTHK
jgi:hypothetical protein